MIWPERPSCHSGESMFAVPEHMIWRLPGWRNHLRSDDDPYGPETFRTCGYCGSIHPEDLVAVLAKGARLQGSDWKYGWPHKFYVEGIPNPSAGTLIPQYVYCGVRDRLGPNAEPTEKGGWREKTGEYPAPRTMPAKWYNRHLLDKGYDDEARQLLIDALLRHAGISFKVELSQLLYAAPYGGYQR